MITQELLNAIRDPKTVFFIIPTNELKKHIINNSDQDISSLPNEIKTSFLENKGYTVDSEMIEKYVKNTLDEKNKKLLSMCEIRVLQDRITCL